MDVNKILESKLINKAELARRLWPGIKESTAVIKMNAKLKNKGSSFTTNEKIMVEEIIRSEFDKKPGEMTRAEIIAEANKVLPSINENNQLKIRIRVWDVYNPEIPAYDSASMTWVKIPNLHEVEFIRCAVNEKRIIVQSWGKLPEGFKEVWIPNELLKIKFPAESVEDLEREGELAKYLLKD